MINKKKLYTGIIIMIVFTITCIGLGISIVKNTKLGLDLQGGIEILYRVEPADGNEVTQELMDSTIDTLTNRVNSFGISETVITQEGDNFIRIQIPGIDDQSNAKEMLGSSAVLTFRDSADNLLMTSDVLVAGKAKLSTDSMGNPAVSLSINDSEQFSSVTGSIATSEDKMMVIWLDYDEATDSYATEKSFCGSSGSNCISAATVQERLSNSAQISGDFTEEEAKNLVSLINSGSLSAKLVEEYSTSIDASLGESALKSSVFAASIGFGLVLLFMIFRYRFVGLVSSFSLVIYTFFVFVIFNLLGGVLTLPGIAALVLGIGMAVDANVITYERIKDELNVSNDLKKAFDFGNKKSFLTILDANVTTLIIAIILFIFGETSVKGFATMLIINIMLTIFITVFFTRWVLRMFVDSHAFDDKTKLFINFSDDKWLATRLKAINYVANYKKFIMVSVILIAVGLISGQVRGYNIGIDFASGTSIMTEISKNESDELVKYIDESYDVVDSNYVDSSNLSVIRLSDSLSDDEVKEITDHISSEYDSKSSVQKVSPTVGKKLVKNAGYSLLIAFVAIVIYITIRFRSSFAVAAIISLFHDLAVMIAMFALFKLTISGVFIAALLAILGYSINDTIVLFDRIRDNINEAAKRFEGKKKKKIKEEDKFLPSDELKEIVNRSAKETVVRSLATSFTTFLPIMALVVFGSSEILEFNIALTIGIISGTYSSIFIAAQVWLLFERKGYRVGKNKDGWFSVDEPTEMY